MTTKASDAPAPPTKTRLAQLAKDGGGGGRRGEIVTIPGLGTARIELLGAMESNAVEAEVIKAMAALGIERSVENAERWELERAWRTLSRAVRDQSDGAAFGTPEEWGDLDNDMINAAWQTYGDVRERLDPLAVPLTDSERIAIETAAKKGAGQLLRTFGLAKLSDYILTTVVPPATSPPPSSSSSESSSEP